MNVKKKTHSNLQRARHAENAVNCSRGACKSFFTVPLDYHWALICYFITRMYCCCLVMCLMREKKKQAILLQ